ncbi:hypothetical protein D3C80_897950 [compost metagenome]
MVTCWPCVSGWFQSPSFNWPETLETVKRFRPTAWVQPPFSPPGAKPAAAYWRLR